MVDTRHDFLVDASKEILSGINRIADIPPTLANKAPPMKQELQGPPPPRPSAGFPRMQNVPSHKKTSEHKEIQHKEFKGMWPSSYSGPPKTKMGYHHHRVDGNKSHDDNVKGCKNMFSYIQFQNL